MQTFPATSKTAFGYQNATYLVRRGSVWQYRRRRLASLAARLAATELRLSTGARARTDALRAAARFSAALEAEWRRLLATPGAASDGTAQAFTEMLAQAQDLGVGYLPAAELATSRLEDNLARIERLASEASPIGDGKQLQPAPATAAVSVVPGVASKPQLKLSNLVEAYQKLAEDQAIGKSEKQLKQWKARHIRSVEALISRIGDKSLADITRDDALDFRDWWIGRIKTEGYNKNSANKNFGCLSAMMRTVDDAFRLNLTLPFKGIRIAGDKHTPRQAYEPDFVRQRFLASEQFGKLNLEACAIIRMVALTGMRPSEIMAFTRPGSEPTRSSASAMGAASRASAATRTTRPVGKPGYARKADHLFLQLPSLHGGST